MSKTREEVNAQFNETLTALLLPISSRMLAGGLGIGELVRAAKQAYLRAAIVHLASAESRVSASHLSVLTGLTRKEVTILLKEMRGGSISGRGEAKEQRARRVLRGWRLDPRFCDNDGSPAALSLRGSRNSFSMLVKLYGGDVTPNSVLRELERMRVVSFNRSRRLKLRSAKVGGKSTEHMTELARLFPDFADTVSPEHPSAERPLFFGFRDSTLDSLDQAALFQRTFSKRALALLQGVHQWLASQDESRPIASKSKNKGVRVGIGVYLVQRSDTSTDRARGDSHPVVARPRRAR